MYIERIRNSKFFGVDKPAMDYLFLQCKNDRDADELEQRLIKNPMWCSIEGDLRDNINKSDPIFDGLKINFDLSG